MICRSCGAANAPEARFCYQCGTSQATAEEERRVVSVVFADIVGFTTLAEHRDPEEVKHLVDRCFAQLTRKITAYGGVVDKIVGDAIVALFGAPIAHEDDPERAVRSALEMQHTLEQLTANVETRMQIRIGVNTGEVLVGSTTAGGDYTAMGDVMNSAARLEQLAEPGQILVGSTTKAATSHAVRYEPLGSLQARGRDEPIEAWLAVEAIRLPGAHRVRSSSFFGRERELSLLGAQGALALQQGGAQAAVITGDAGLGKTRLVSEAAARIVDEADAVLLEARCLPYGEANVWWPVAEILRQVFGLSNDLGLEVVEPLVRGELSSRFSPISSSALDRLKTAILHTLGYETPLRNGDRSRNRDEVIGSFVSVLESELAVRPVVIALSDMHWAGDAMWELLRRTLVQHADDRLLVLATARSFDDGLEQNPLTSGRHGVLVLPLSSLGKDAALNLLDDLDMGLSSEMAREILDKAGGNPFFLEELAGLVHERGIEPSGQPARSVLSADGLRQLPDTLRGIVAARLDALDAPERALVEDASVLGSSGTLRSLAMLTEHGARTAGVGFESSESEDRFASTLRSLVAKDLLSTDGSRFEFRSDLVRDVAYGTLTKTARAQRHHLIARHVEQRPGPLRNSVVVAIADHYRAAAQLSAELFSGANLDRVEIVSKALYWLEQAGERALSAGEPGDSERWFSYGVDLAGDNETLARFVLGRAKARCEVHDLAGSRADLSKLESLQDADQRRSAEALLTKGDVMRKSGDLDHAASVLREASARLAALNLPHKQSLALRLLGLTEMARMDDSLARQALEASRRVAAESNDRRGEAWALQSMAWYAFDRGRVLEANRLAAQAIELFVELGDRGGLAWARGVQAWVAFHLGRWETTRELLDSVLPETRRRNDPWAEAIMVSLASSLELWSGRAVQALELAREAQQLARRAEDGSLLVQSLALEGRALVSLGRVAEGGKVLGEAFSEADSSGDPHSRRIAIISNCASAARLGEPERAMRWASRYEGPHDDPTVVGEADLIVALALALLQRGNVDEAKSQLSWVDAAESRPDEHTIDHYAEAVRAIVASSEGRIADVESSLVRVLNDNATYLDRMLAYLAQATARFQRGDERGSLEALTAARGQITPTDDAISRFVVELVEAVCGHGDLVAVRRRMRNAGLDPLGLETMWSHAARVPVVSQ